MTGLPERLNLRSRNVEIRGAGAEIGDRYREGGRMIIRLGILCCALFTVPLQSTASQTRPLIDYHQHLFSPATVALISPRPLPPVALPQELDVLVQTRARSQGVSPLRDLYTEDAWLLHSSNPSWIRGPEAIVAALIRSADRPFHLTPVGWSTVDSAGYITAFVTQGQRDSARHVAQVLLSVRRGPDARWRIAAEAYTASGPPVNPISASDLVALLDAADIQRALVLSMGYTWGSPNRTVENEYQKVMAENDWTSQQVGSFPDRLRGFCSFNPFKPYALDELSRCSKDPNLRSGLKLHFGNSVLDYHNPEHIKQLRRVFRTANHHRMAIVVHMRSSISRGLPYGRDEALIFLNEVLPAAPDVPVQIAHLAGAGGYDDPSTDEALGVFAEAVANGDPRTKNLYFEVSSAVGIRLGISVDKADLIARRIRQIGVDRILFGSDAATGPNLAPREAWVAFRQLPLSDEEFRTIANNVASYMR